jgi:hypothetical protein
MNKLLICISIFLFFGCGKGSKNKNIEDIILGEMTKKYDHAISFFGKPMTNHFPKRIESKDCSFTDSYSSELGNLELVLQCSAENKYLSDLLKEYEKSAVAKYKATDSCLLVVNRFVNNDRHYKIKPTQNELRVVEKDCYSNQYPIPNFWHNHFTIDSTECKLSEDFNIYVIEAKKGKYFEQYLSVAWFMPEKWRHGYSKGVAISEENNSIIYWLIIW